MAAPIVAPEFGRIVDGAQVEAAALDTLQRWLVTYLAEVERQNGLAPRWLPHIRSWEVLAGDPDTWPEDQLPAVVLLSPGLLGDEDPPPDGRGVYRATWQLAVGVFVSAQDRRGTARIARLYAAAIRACLIQQRSLGGFARGCRWTDEAYDELPADSARTLAAARLTFAIEVEQVAARDCALKAPPADPYATPDAIGVAERVDVDLDRRPPGGAAL